MYFRTDASAIKTKFSSAGLSSGQESGKETEGVFDCVGVGVGVFALTGTPLFQNNFLPDLVQVYFLPKTIEEDPALLQGEPAFTAAKAVAVSEQLTKMQESRRVNDFFMT
jgi:hypothetical protein